MKIQIYNTSAQLGQAAADYTSEILRKAIRENGNARLLLSTGASQFDTIQALIQSDVDWSRVEMFHLDEYVNLPETHGASFRKYLKERFISKVPLKAAYLVEGSADSISSLSAELRKSPIDVGLIGIGENAHIAFNDPPANFDTDDAYIVVNLSDTCRAQQVGEGWFPTPADVPGQAVSMTVHQIMQCKRIVSCVPYAVKAQAVKDTLENTLTPDVPATMLKRHKDFSLFLDSDSASLINRDKIIADSDMEYTLEIFE